MKNQESKKYDLDLVIVFFLIFLLRGLNPVLANNIFWLLNELHILLIIIIIITVFELVTFLVFNKVFFKIRISKKVLKLLVISITCANIFSLVVDLMLLDSLAHKIRSLYYGDLYYIVEASKWLIYIFLDTTLEFPIIYIFLKKILKQEELIIITFVMNVVSTFLFFISVLV